MEKTETEHKAPVRLAFRVAYLGDKFFGSQMQADLRTVEGEFVAACTRLGLFSDYRNAGFLASGRTDRGVHARGQVYAFTTGFPARAIQLLNWQLPRDCWVSAYAEVAENFHPRYDALSRTYRYYFADDELDIDAMDSAAASFIGNHDFSSYARIKDKNPFRTVLKAQVISEGDHCVLEVTAESFLWHMVRYMAASLHLVGKGERDREAIESRLNGEQQKTIGPAPPEHLVLWDVDFGFPFTLISGIGRSATYMQGLRTHHAVMANICATLISVDKK